MLLTLGKKYSTKELCKELGISTSTFSHKKNEYLDSLSRAYEYEISYKGRAAFYTITNQIADFEKPERKNAREKNDAVIHQFIRDVIAEDNIQTAANIGRRAFESFTNDVKTEIAELGLKESTAKEYIRIRMREMFGTKVGESGTDGFIEGKIWCKLDATFNVYEPLKETIIKDYIDMVNNHKQQAKKEDLDIVADYDNGLITREEMIAALGEFNYNIFKEAKKEFAAKYGFYPIKVPVYQLNAWTEKTGKYNKEIINDIEVWKIKDAATGSEEEIGFVF